MRQSTLTKQKSRPQAPQSVLAKPKTRRPMAKIFCNTVTLTGDTAPITTFFVPGDYVARYLDARASRWISGDPALGEYIPGAPINDEAKKRNGNLPGQGGVFNVINLHVYHYAANNPVRYVDPDGRTPVKFANGETNVTVSGSFPDSGIEYSITISGTSITGNSYAGGALNKVNVKTSVGTGPSPPNTQTTVITYGNNSKTPPHTETDHGGTLPPTTTQHDSWTIIDGVVVNYTDTSTSGGMMAAINLPDGVTVPDVIEIDVTLRIIETGESITEKINVLPPPPPNNQDE